VALVIIRRCAKNISGSTLAPFEPILENAIPSIVTILINAREEFWIETLL